MSELLQKLRSFPPDVVAGLAGGLLAPIASFGFGAPIWVSLVGAVLVYAGARLALTSRPYEPFDPAALSAASAGLAREVTAAARGETRKLLACASALREPGVRAHLMNLYTLGSKVIGEVERNPQRLGSVRRLLTYYLPAAARLAEGFRVLESARFPDGARLAATATMIERLHETCARQADRLNETDVDGLDVELKLLDDAIGEEDRGRPAALPPPGLSLPDSLPRQPVPLPVDTSQSGSPPPGSPASGPPPWR